MIDRPGSLLTRGSPLSRLGFNWLPRLATPPPDVKIRTFDSSDASAPTITHPERRRHGRLGYLPDLPDARDLTLDPIELKRQPLEPIRRTFERIRQANVEAGHGGADEPVCSFLFGEHEMPLDGAACDLRDTGCLSRARPPGELANCTAVAVLGLVEYLLRAGAGIDEDFSARFLYKQTRRLLRLQGDVGAGLRATIKALRRFGVPPESAWPGSAIADCDAEPDACHYVFAPDFRDMCYARLDGRNQDAAHTLDLIRHTLLDGFPIVFGFPVYGTIDNLSAANGWIVPPPRGQRGERLLGGHAALIVGFDDHRITGDDVPGALIIRSSWGAEWGDRGYAYLPYAYVLQQLAADFWTIFTPGWIALEHFE